VSWVFVTSVEGSVRKAGNRVRISGQLIDAATGVHLWADRFDGALEDEARAAMLGVRRIDPTLRISNLRKLHPFHRPEDFARWQEGLRLAGLPE
jgi:hypothetical protein